MFKNREFRIKMVKTPDAQPKTMEQLINPDSVALIEEAGKSFVKKLATTVVATVVVIKVVDTLCEIAVNAAPKR